MNKSRKQPGRSLTPSPYLSSGEAAPYLGLDERTLVNWLAEATRRLDGLLHPHRGTSSGKITLANALLREISFYGERVVILEDTRELHCAADDVVALRTRAGSVSLADLVRSTLRLRPDRVVVGEVRGPEALDLLNAWNTGHPGGIATLHANGARAALTRLEQLVQEVVVAVPKALIAEAIDIVVFLAGRGAARRVESIVRVEGLAANGDYALADLVPWEPQPGKEAP
jgi:type IV secretion system protein VirB11